MISCKINNSLITNSVAIAIQVSFIFSFLSTFFFFYVTKIEKEEFKTQINIIVDNIIDDIFYKSKYINPIDNSINKKDLSLVINEIINIMEEKITIQSKGPVQDVAISNATVKKKAFHSVTTLLLIIITITFLLIIIGFCIPVKQNIKDSLIAVFFVALTEFSFLTLIASKYIAASPNKVKITVGEEIQKWILKNKVVLN